MALQAWDKNYREQLKIQQQEIESLQQQLMISQHASPYIPQERPREGVGGTNEHPFDDFGNDRNPPVINPATGKPEWAGTSQGLKIAHGEGRGPQPKYHDEYNRELPIPPWMQMFPDGKVREIPWMKEQYMREHPELFSGATSRQIRDRLKGFTRGGPYDEQGGSLRGVPDALRIQLLRDAMA